VFILSFFPYLSGTQADRIAHGMGQDIRHLVWISVCLISLGIIKELSTPLRAIFRMHYLSFSVLVMFFFPY